MSFTRRYSSDPGLAELAKIEGLVIIDNNPPQALAGGTTGMVNVVGEFEDGPYEVPTELFSNTDFANIFGGFGFTYDGIPSNNPCARARYADGALNPEYWNGNGFVACASKIFRRLSIVRVDTSVGSVSFTRRASILGNSKFQWDLEPGQQVTLDLGAGAVSAIFNATVASLVSGAQTYPTGFVGGEKMRIVVDEGTTQQIGPFDVVFLAGDTTQAAVIARINLAAGFTLAIANSGTVTRLDGRVRGTSGNVRVVSQDASVATALGWSTVAAAGGGNVANIDAVTFTELKTVVEAGIAGTIVERTPSGLLRIAASSAPTITPLAATTADDLGLVEGVAGTASAGNAGFIPAGTRVRTAGGTEWVTCQTVAVLANSAGPYTVKVRPALDDGTVAGAIAGAVNVLPFAAELASFSVLNALPLTAALTEAAIDAAYLRALDKTLSPNAVTKDCELMVCARQSNAIRQAGRSNAINASNGGLKGRKFIMRPPLGTSRAAARSASVQPGAGAYRSDRVIYSFPGCYFYLPQIATRGLAGGAGFSADGNIDAGFDCFEASCISQTNPEENPGQLGQTMNLVLGLERNNADVQSMTMEDYVALKAAGIAALFMENGVATIESGVVNVDPSQFANIANIARRRMADYIQDSLADALKPFVKKLGTRERRAQCLGVVEEFLASLKSVGNAAAQRIDDYKVDGKSGNTPESLARGVFRIIVRVRLLASMDVIVLDTTIGETVTFQELPAAA